MPKVPFTLFASPGLGLSHSSQDFVSLLNTDVINAGRTKIAVNAATGNVVIQDTQFSIRDDGVDLNIGMLWNAQDPITPWRLGVAAKIKVANWMWQYMPQAMGGQTLTLIEADGREIIYLFDKDNNCYLCTEPDQFGVTRLSITAEWGYERYFPHDGSREIFNSNGDLVKKILVPEKEIITTYDENNGVTLTLSMEEQTFTLIEANGRIVIYRFDKGNNCYLCTKPGQFGIIRLSITAEGEYERYFPHDGSREIFNKNGKLVKKILVAKKEIIFTYDENNGVTLTLPSKRILKLKADANIANLKNLILIHDDKTSIKLASYKSDPNKIYDLVTQVWQNNKDIYTTKYSFQGNIFKIEASDQTKMLLTFDQQKVIQSFAPGLPEEKLVANWRFNLLSAQDILEFFDSYNNKYVVSFDKDKILTAFKKPQDTKPTTYQFKSNQLCQIVNVDGISCRFEYDGVTGLPCREVDRLQTQTQTVYFTADIKSNLLGAKIAEYQSVILDRKDEKEINLRRDGKDSKKDSKDVTSNERGHWFIYNAQRQLIYTISAAGRVSQYNYDDKAHLITRQQARPLYDIAKLNFSDPKTYPDEKTLNNWWNLKIQNAQDLQITQFDYDDYGRKKGEGAFTQVAQNDQKQWVGVLTNNIQYTKLVLDPCGNIIEHHVATSYNSETQQLQFRTTLTDYDRLARPLKLERVATGAAGLENQDRKKLDIKYSGDEKSIVTNYRYTANQKITRFANGLIQKRIYNSSYECIEENRTASNAESRLQTYKRDVHGRIQHIIYADKRIEYFFYDVAGRLQCKIEPNGRLSTYTYDSYDNLIVEKTYKKLIPDLDKLTRETLNNWIRSNQHYAGKIYIYDQENQLRYEIKVKTVIDEKSQSTQQGFVTEYQYLFSNKIAIIEYENTLINLQNVDLANLPSMITKMGGKYRETRNFFDADNLLIGTQILSDWQIESATGNLIPIGFLTEYIRNGLTNIICERVYLKPLKMGKSLDEIRSSQQSYETLDTLHFYDNAGNRIATIDADRYLIAFTQNSNGELTQEVSYLTVLDAKAFDANKGTITIPAPTDKDRIKKIEYDSFGRQKKVTQSHTQLQIEIDYDSDDREITHIETDLLRPESKARSRHYVYNLFGELISEASPRILAADTKADAPNWTTHFISPITGLKLCTHDPLGYLTIYFYDKQRRLDTLINAEGGITRYQYDRISEQPSEIYQYYTPLTSAVLQNLQQLQQNPTSTGFIQTDILQLPPKQPTLDRVTTMKYDETGLCVSKTAPNGAEQQLSYTSFGQLKTERRAVDATRVLEVVYEYDWRGNRTATIYDPKTLKVQITQQFNDPLNRVTTYTDKLQQQLQYQYKGLRQQTVTSLDLNNDVKNNGSTKNQRNSVGILAATPMQSSANAKSKESKKIVYSTKGEGDCGFHAALGKWNGRQYECKNIDEERAKVAKVIKECKKDDKDDKIYPLVVAGVEALVMGADRGVGGAIQKLREAYQVYIDQQGYKQNESATLFESCLDKKEYSAIVRHITTNVAAEEKRNPNPARRFPTLCAKFNFCLNIKADKAGETLEALIQSSEELNKALQAYNAANAAGDKGFNLKARIGAEIIRDYADFIARQKQWLLPHELDLIARVNGITIKLYTPDVKKGPFSLLDTYNPGAPREVEVRFDSAALHYERVTRNNGIQARLRRQEPSNSVVSNSIDAKAAQPTPLPNDYPHGFSLRQNNDEKCQQIKLFDGFMRVLSESQWDGTNTTYIYDDIKRTQQILSPEQRSQILRINAFSEIEMRTQFGGEIKYEYGVDGQLERTLYPNGYVEVSQFNLLGWRASWLKDQKYSTYEYNKVGHNTKLIDGLTEKLVTVYTPNVFGETEVIVLPDQISQAFRYKYNDQKEEKAAVTKTKIDDPQNLKLVTQEKYNYQNKLIEIQQGDSKDTTQYYVEVIQQDLLNREAKREVKLENQQTLLLNQQTYNAADAVLTVSDGLGQIKRKIYDVRGNLRFQIDATGFVVEKRYDVNDREIIRREYVVPLNAQQLSTLSDQSKPKDIEALVVVSDTDAVRQRIYDGDGLLRFEISFLNHYENVVSKSDYKDDKSDDSKDNIRVLSSQNSNEKSQARLTEWRYNSNGQCIERYRYANPIVYPNDLVGDENNVASLAQMQALIKTTSFAQNPKNRISYFAYNKLGQMILKRDPEGYVVETRRDTQNKVIARIQYADCYSELDFSQNVVTLQAQLNNNPKKYQTGRYNFFVYDVFGNLRFSIDGNGFVKEQRFDAANRLKDVYYYVNKLSTKLNNNELIQLYNVLINDTKSRNITAIINETLVPIVQKIASLAHDFHEQRQYDKAGRLRVEIDGENFQQRWKPNALGLNVERYDKNQQRWITQFDAAKRIQQDISPEIDVSLVEYDEKSSLLKERKIKSSVNTYFEYDAASNIRQVTYAKTDANQSLEPRVVKSEYDRNNTLIATVVSDVMIDDGTANIVHKNKRPEINKPSLEKSIVRDYARREIVNINENGAAHFVIYDRSGRQCFNIDADGFVCEFRYDYSFKNPTQIIHYAEMISTEVIANRLNGFNYTEMLEFVAKADLTKARIVTLTYDRRGLKLTATKDQIITAAFSSKANRVVGQLISPQTLWQYNAFAEVTQENRLIDGNANREITNTFYDNNGNAILQLSPGGYVLQKEYGAYHPKQKKYLLLRSTEYANAITANRQDYKACLEALIPNPIKDRNHAYTYDRRFLCVLEKIYSQDNFYSSDLSDANVPQLNINKDLGVVSYKTVYDGEEQAIVYTQNSTGSRYIQRNARGDVVFETDFPQVLNLNMDPLIGKNGGDLKDSKGTRSVGNKAHEIKAIVIAIPAIQHLVNAHGQRVGTRKFINSATISVDENGRVEFTAPKINDEQDQLSLVLMSNRGYATITQNPQRQLKHTTFDATGKIIRSYYWRQSGYTLPSAQINAEDPSLAFLGQVPNFDSKSTPTFPKADSKLQDVEPTLTQALSLQRYNYNNRGLIIFQSVIDDTDPAVKATELQTYKKYNAFGECEGEGPSDNEMRVIRAFDKAGNVWFTNEDQGIATVNFYDGRGNTVATFRSAELDLLSFQQDPLGQIAAKRQLLDSDYSQIYKLYQRTFLQRDMEGNVVEQYTPGFEKRDHNAPKNLSIAFSLTSDTRISPGEQSKALTWPASDEEMLKPRFVIRPKGTQQWLEPLTIKKSPGVRGVDLNTLNLPTDMYEYQLDYYYLDPDTKTPDPVPNYRAEGEIVIDTGNYKKTENLIWYLQNETTLVLTGDIKDVSGIELIKDEKPIARIAGTNIGNGKVVVELADQVSGDYDFRVLKGIEIVQQNLPFGKTGNYNLDLYTPAFEFYIVATRNPNFPFNHHDVTSNISWSSLPDEIKQIQIKFLQMEFNYSSNTFNYSDKSIQANTAPQKIPYGLPAINDISNSFPLLNFSGMAPFVNFAFYATDTQHEKPRNWLLGTFPACSECSAYDGRPYPISNTGYGIPYTNQFTRQAFLYLKDTKNNPAHALSISDAKNKNYGNFQLRNWIGGSYKVDWKDIALDAKSVNAKVLSVSQAVATGSMHRLHVQTLIPAKSCNTQIIKLTNFKITKCQMMPVIAIEGALQLNYAWDINVAADHYLQVTHTGLNPHWGSTTTALPLAVGNLQGQPTVQDNKLSYPLQFQKRFFPATFRDINQRIGMITYALVMNDDVIPIAQEIEGNVQDIDSPEIVVPKTNAGEFRIKIIDITSYPDRYTLYISNLPVLPQNVSTVEFQYFEPGILNKAPQPRVLQATITTSRKAIAVPITGLNSGQYNYHFRFWDADKKPVVINIPDMKQEKDGWFNGSFVFQKGNGAVFFSRSKPEELKFHQPLSIKATYDRWHNRTSVTNRSLHTTSSEFNLFNDEIKTTTPPVMSVNAAGVESIQPLVTQYYFNTNRQKIAERAPNGGMKIRIVNQRGQSLLEVDADGVRTTTNWDLLGRRKETADVNGNQTTYRYANSKAPGLREEKRTLPGQLPETYEINSENCRVRLCDVVVEDQKLTERNWYFNYNANGHEILRINPLKKSQTQKYDARTQTRILLKDEDGNQQTWETDKYFANVVEHTDFSGQKIKYPLNFNKQRKNEIGTTDIEIDKRRGKTNLNPADDKSALVPARNIGYVYDAAGHMIKIADDGAQSTTIKEYDDEDYVTMVKFEDNNDGGTYQATNTKYDELHRIRRIYDTRYDMYMTYDLNSNRRSARAYFYGDDLQDENVMRESWYDYTAAGRVLVRDAKLTDSKISISGQGMQLVYDPNDRRRITQQITQDAKGIHTKTLCYEYPKKNLLTSIHNDDGTIMRREWDIANRCHAIVLEKDKVVITADILHYRHDDVVDKQTHEEKGKVQSARTSTLTSAGRIDTEKNVFSGEVDSVNFTITDNYKSEYYYTDDVKLQNVTVTRENPQNVAVENAPKFATVYTTQDANGNIKTVQGALIEDESFREFRVNSENCIVWKRSARGINYYFYAEKQPGKPVLIAYFGDIPDDIKQAKFKKLSLVEKRAAFKKWMDSKKFKENPPVVNIDTNHQALSPQYPPAVPSRYVLPSEMDFNEIADALNYTGYAEQIAAANNHFVSDKISAKSTIIIPPLYFEVAETAWNGSIPAAEKIIGSLYPVLPIPIIYSRPKPPHRPKHNFFTRFLEIAASVAVMVFAPELFAEVIGITFQAIGLTGATLEAATGIASFAAAGAAANLTSQSIAIAAGEQKDINLKSLATSTLSAAVTAGVTRQINGLPLLKSGTANAGEFEGFNVANLVKSIVTAEAIAVTQQAILVATRLERSFDWKALGAAAFSASVRGGLTAMNADKAFITGVSAVADPIGHSFIHNEHLDAPQVTASALGQMVGSYVGSKVLDQHLVAQQQRREKELASKLENLSPQHAAHAASIAVNRVMKANAATQAHIKRDIKTGVTSATRSASSTLHDESDISDWNNMSDAKNAPASLNPNLERLQRYRQNPMGDSKNSSSFWNRPALENLRDGARNFAGKFFNELRGTIRDHGFDLVSEYANKSLAPMYSSLIQQVRVSNPLIPKHSFFSKHIRINPLPAIGSHTFDIEWAKNTLHFAGIKALYYSSRVAPYVFAMKEVMDVKPDQKVCTITKVASGVIVGRMFVVVAEIGLEGLTMGAATPFIVAGTGFAMATLGAMAGEDSGKRLCNTFPSK